MKRKDHFEQAIKELSSQDPSPSGVQRAAGRSGAHSLHFPPSAQSAPSPASPPSSGRFSISYTRLRSTLTGYLSPILVDSVLSRAMDARGLAPETVSKRALSELTSDIMLGLRLFVPNEQLSALMVELAEILEDEA